MVAVLALCATALAFDPRAAGGFPRSRSHGGPGWFPMPKARKAQGRGSWIALLFLRFPTSLGSALRSRSQQRVATEQAAYSTHQHIWDLPSFLIQGRLNRRHRAQNPATFLSCTPDVRLRPRFDVNASLGRPVKRIHLGNGFLLRLPRGRHFIGPGPCFASE